MTPIGQEHLPSPTIESSRRRRVLVGGIETGSQARKEVAICLDADSGKVLWSHAIRPVTSPQSVETQLACRGDGRPFQRRGIRRRRCVE